MKMRRRGILSGAIMLAAGLMATGVTIGASVSAVAAERVGDKRRLRSGL